MKVTSFPIIEREPRVTFLKFADHSLIVLREDGKCYVSLPYPPSRAWFPGVRKQDLQAFDFFEQKGEAYVREIMTGFIPQRGNFIQGGITE